MEPKRTMPLASSKEAYCLWYEFALIAMNMKVADLRAMEMDTPEIREAIKTAKRFYAPWDLDKRLAPDKWWKSHSPLFEENQGVRVLKVGEKPRAPDALIIEVPMTLTATKLKKAVAALIAEEMGKRSRLWRADLSKPTAVYRITPGKKFNTKTFGELRVYLDTRLANPELRGRALLEKVVHAFQLRKDKTGARLPDPFTPKKEQGEDRIRAMVRNMNRNLWKSRSILLNIIEGEFPGDYWR